MVSPLNSHKVLLDKSGMVNMYSQPFFSPLIDCLIHELSLVIIIFVGAHKISAGPRGRWLRYATASIVHSAPSILAGTNAEKIREKAENISELQVHLRSCAEGSPDKVSVRLKPKQRKKITVKIPSQCRPSSGSAPLPLPLLLVVPSPCPSRLVPQRTCAVR